MIRASNRASSVLANSINTVVTALNVTSGDEGKFPSPTGGDWFPLCIIDSAGNMEIVKCTARVGTTLTIQRAREGTTARSFTAGSSRVEVRLTAVAFEEAQTGLQANIDLKADQTALDTVDNELQALSLALGPGYGAAATAITDWNDAVDNGVYRGNAAANSPSGAVWWMGFVETYLPTQYVTQTVHGFLNDSDADTFLWRRHRNAGTWTPWYLLRWSAVEQDARYMQIAGGTFTGNITIAKASPVINMDAAAAGQGRSIIAKTNNVNRWAFSLGNSSAETGSNAGSDFQLARYSDAGTFLGNSIIVNRSTGAITVEGSNQIFHAGNASRGAPDAVLEDRKGQNNAGQTLAANTWVTHDLNTEVRDAAAIVSLSSNQFTVTDDAWAEWQVVGVNGFATRLYNVTDAAVVANSLNGLTGSATNAISTGGGLLVAGKTYRIEIYSTGTNGGFQNNITGRGETYARVLIFRR